MRDKVGTVRSKNTCCKGQRRPLNARGLLPQILIACCYFSLIFQWRKKRMRRLVLVIFMFMITIQSRVYV